jgi:putative SOS response-associated peptidase YedK
MCASYGLETTPEALEEHFAFDERGRNEAVAEWLAQNSAATVRPTGPRALNLSPIVRESALNGGSVRRADLAWWQLWVGGTRPPYSTINARSEKLSAGAWAAPSASRRALVPVTSYVEKAHRFGFGGELFGLAAIYNVDRSDVAQDPDGRLVSYAIVTRPAMSEISGIHDRMPLIIPPAQYADWLATGQADVRSLVDAAIADSRLPAVTPPSGAQAPGAPTLF